MNKPTLIIGASNNPDRYACKAQLLLKAKGHTTIPVNPKESIINGDPVVANLSNFQGEVDTVTVYVRPPVLAGMIDDIIALKPERVLFNPNTEDAALRAKLNAAGIETLEACTLVLLNSDQY